MVEYRSDMVETLIKDVNQVEGKLVTMDILGEELATERKSNIKQDIEQMATVLKEVIVEKNEATVAHFEIKIEK